MEVVVDPTEVVLLGFVLTAIDARKLSLLLLPELALLGDYALIITPNANLALLWGLVSHVNWYLYVGVMISFYVVDLRYI